MKAFFCLAISIFISICSLRAQPPEQIKITAAQTEQEILSMKELYRYPQFTLGQVHFRSGDVSNALLNYNYLVAAIQFFSPKGDTLNLTDERNIQYISIGKDTFFYDKVYLMQVDGDAQLKLAKHQMFKVGNKEKGSAYGYSSGAGAIATYGSVYNSGPRASKLTKNENLTMVKEERFYIGDKYNRFFAVNKKNLLKNYAKNKEQVEAYLNGTSINYAKEADMLQLLRFLQSL